MRSKRDQPDVGPSAWPCARGPFPSTWLLQNRGSRSEINKGIVTPLCPPLSPHRAAFGASFPQGYPFPRPSCMEATPFCTGRWFQAILTPQSCFLIRLLRQPRCCCPSEASAVWSPSPRGDHLPTSFTPPPSLETRRGAIRGDLSLVDVTSSLTSLGPEVFTHIPPQLPHLQPRSSAHQTPNSLRIPDHQLRYPPFAPALRVLSPALGSHS